MTQRLKSLQKDLLSAVGLGLVRFGFDERLRGQSFWKPTPFGRVSFHLSFINHSDDFDVTADVGIRYDAVQELLTRDNKLLRPSQKADTYTMGIELGNLSEGKQRRWTIRTIEDVANASISIVTAFSELGMPYLERYSDADNALEMLSRDDRESWRHVAFHDHRAKLAVALALLTKGPDVARELAKAKLSFLESVNDPGRTSFRGFLRQVELMDSNGE